MTVDGAPTGMKEPRAGLTLCITVLASNSCVLKCR